MNSAAIGVLAESGLHGPEAEVALRRLLSVLAGDSEPKRHMLEALDIEGDDVDPSILPIVVVIRRLANAGLGASAAKQAFGENGGAAYVALRDRLDRFGEQ